MLFDSSPSLYNFIPSFYKFNLFMDEIMTAFSFLF